MNRQARSCVQPLPTLEKQPERRNSVTLSLCLSHEALIKHRGLFTLSRGTFGPWKESSTAPQCRSVLKPAPDRSWQVLMPWLNNDSCGLCQQRLCRAQSYSEVSSLWTPPVIFLPSLLFFSHLFPHTEYIQLLSPCLLGLLKLCQHDIWGTLWMWGRGLKNKSKHDNLKSETQQSQPGIEYQFRYQLT